VIPYDATWTAATADAAASRLVIAKTVVATQEYLTGDASGYSDEACERRWGYGVFALTLDFPGFDGHGRRRWRTAGWNHVNVR
jgi:hypothetical protein